MCKVGTHKPTEVSSNINIDHALSSTLSTEICSDADTKAFEEHSAQAEVYENSVVVIILDYFDKSFAVRYLALIFLRQTFYRCLI